MKSKDQSTETKTLTTLSAAELQLVSGGRYGINRPRGTGNRPR